jgi:hypothetical protein
VPPEAQRTAGAARGAGAAAQGAMARRAPVARHPRHPRRPDAGPLAHVQAKGASSCRNSSRSRSSSSPSQVWRRPGVGAARHSGSRPGGVWGPHVRPPGRRRLVSSAALASRRRLLPRLLSALRAGAVAPPAWHGWVVQLSSYPLTRRRAFSFLFKGGQGAGWASERAAQAWRALPLLRQAVRRLRWAGPDARRGCGRLAAQRAGRAACW